MPWGGIWKEYGMKYAHSAMGGNTDQFPSIQKQPHRVPDQTPLDGAAKTALAIKALDGADKDAEACLKQEFKLWLQGIHPVHNAAATDRTPHNSDAHKKRAIQKRHIFPKTQDLMLKPHDDWRDTPWGNASLSSLPGVRQYLTAGQWAETEQDAQMNLLAEYGPNNIDEAWTYFKYWVKGAPMGPPCKDKSGNDIMTGYDGPMNNGVNGPRRGRFTNGTNETPDKYYGRYGGGSKILEEGEDMDLTGEMEAGGGGTASDPNLAANIAMEMRKILKEVLPKETAVPAPPAHPDLTSAVEGIPEQISKSFAAIMAEYRNYDSDKNNAQNEENRAARERDAESHKQELINMDSEHNQRIQELQNQYVENNNGLQKEIEQNRAAQAALEAELQKQRSAGEAYNDQQIEQLRIVRAEADNLKQQLADQARQHGQAQHDLEVVYKRREDALQREAEELRLKGEAWKAEMEEGAQREAVRKEEIRKEEEALREALRKEGIRKEEEAWKAQMEEEAQREAVRKEEIRKEEEALRVRKEEIRKEEEALREALREALPEPSPQPPQPPVPPPAPAPVPDFLRLQLKNGQMDFDQPNPGADDLHMLPVDMELDKGVGPDGPKLKPSPYKFKALSAEEQAELTKYLEQQKAANDLQQQQEEEENQANEEAYEAKVAEKDKATIAQINEMPDEDSKYEAMLDFLVKKQEEEGMSWEGVIKEYGPGFPTRARLNLHLYIQKLASAKAALKKARKESKLEEKLGARKLISKPKPLESSELGRLTSSQAGRNRVITIDEKGAAIVKPPLTWRSDLLPSSVLGSVSEAVAPVAQARRIIEKQRARERDDYSGQGSEYPRILQAKYGDDGEGIRGSQVHRSYTDYTSQLD